MLLPLEESQGPGKSRSTAAKKVPMPSLKTLPNQGGETRQQGVSTERSALSTVGARRERRRETPRSISRDIPATIPEQARVELLSHANGGVSGSGVSH